MKQFVGLSFIILGICLMLYFGVWWAFIGGAVAVIEEIRSPQLNSLNLACGIARVFFAGAIGWVCGIIPMGIGAGILKD